MVLGDDGRGSLTKPARLGKVSENTRQPPSEGRPPRLPLEACLAAGCPGRSPLEARRDGGGPDGGVDAVAA